MAEPVNGQGDWGAGIYRGREAPANAAYDLLNCLLDDEGQPFRRGGSAYKMTSDAPAALQFVWDGDVFAGHRTVVGTASGGYPLNVDDVTLNTTALAAPFASGPFGRGVAVGSLLFMRVFDGTSYRLRAYGGSYKTWAWSPAGTFSISPGSTTLTVSGGGLLANVDKGMLVGTPNEDNPLIVEEVLTDTSAKVRNPATVALSLSGLNFSSASYGVFSGVFTLAQRPGPLASAARRLIICRENRAYFSQPGRPQPTPSYDPGANYHELPTGSVITGAEGVGDSCLLFTASGVWAISNMEFDPLDDAGNIQHTVRQVNELVLWGDEGIAQWRGAPVVPAVDNVWLMPLGAEPVPIGGALLPLYPEYVAAGYQPGFATVHRGHYFLPILNGASVVDVLVCRLDRGFAWTRWSGHAAGLGFARRIGAGTRSPRLFGISGARLTDLTGCFNPSGSNASEADGTTHPVTIDTRDYPTPGGGKGSTTLALKVAYEAAAAGTPVVTADFSRGLEGAGYTALTLVKGGAASDGQDHSVWRVNKQARAIRFRIQSSSALSSFKLRSLEAPWRQSGLR